MEKNSYIKWLIIFLWLITIHSLIIGLLLIFLPVSAFHFFGFEIEIKFFTIQSGVLHILMALVYSIAALYIYKAKLLIIYIFIVKFTASIFLTIFYYFIDSILIVLLSGITDFLMGITIFILFFKTNKELN